MPGIELTVKQIGKQSGMASRVHTGNGDYPGGCYVVCVSGQWEPRRNEQPCCEHIRNSPSGRYSRMRISFSRKRGNPSAAHA